jgi:hypothetical protein
MDVNTLLRKVKRQFGDEYGHFINDQDILDWTNEAQLNILRDTSSNDRELVIPANLFPYTLTGRIIIKRVSVNNRALLETSINELDLNRLDVAGEGTAQAYYVEDGAISLYPVPASTDIYDVSITYTVIPDELNVVAPWLSFVPSLGGAPYLSVANDPAYVGNSLFLYWDITIKDITGDDWIIASKANNYSAVATDFSWILLYVAAAGEFQLNISNGTTTRIASLNTATVLANNGRYRYGLVYDAASGDIAFYRYDLVADVPTPVFENTVDTGSGINLYNVSAPVRIGAVNQSFPPSGYTIPAKVPSMLVHEFKFAISPLVASVPLIWFNGENDLLPLSTPDVDAINISSTQSVSISTAPGILEYADNSLAVPEVYHEDIVRFCLSRAHGKNQNYRAEEATMREFDNKISNRRTEADGTDGPLYRIADPDDYDMLGYYA